MKSGGNPHSMVSVECRSKEGWGQGGHTIDKSATGNPANIQNIAVAYTATCGGIPNSGKTQGLSKLHHRIFMTKKQPGLFD